MSDRDHPAITDLYERANRIRTDMGGAEKVKQMRDQADRTIREHIDGLLDPGSFRELGTFTRSLRPEDRDRTPGDGKIGGHGLVDGRPVAVFGDDITVLRGSSSTVGTRKEYRLYERALAMGIPILLVEPAAGASWISWERRAFPNPASSLPWPADGTKCAWPPPLWGNLLGDRRFFPACQILLS